MNIPEELKAILKLFPEEIHQDIIDKFKERRNLSIRQRLKEDFKPTEHKNKLIECATGLKEKFKKHDIVTWKNKDMRTKQIPDNRPALFLEYLSVPQNIFCGNYCYPEYLDCLLLALDDDDQPIRFYAPSIRFKHYEIEDLESIYLPK